MKVIVYGAGSIGNHLTYACRDKGWDVCVCDMSAEALDRMQNQIYPERYGAWDKQISCVLANDVKSEAYDLVIIGTPPDTHVKVAEQALQRHKPKYLLIEKPLCTPSLEGVWDLYKEAEELGTKLLVGYNHTLTEHTREVVTKLKQGILGKPLYLTTCTKEHWGGIFAAHPWLAGPKDSYLGFSSRGGGALGEHSHALNIWQYFSSVVGQGRIDEVTAFMCLEQNNGLDYDSLSHLHVKTSTGFQGDITQDVITQPAKKMAWIQGDECHIEWIVNYDKQHDAFVIGEEPTLFEKTRPDDFKGEISHIADLLAGSVDYIDSPISFYRGVETMLVIAAAFKSYKTKKTICIEYPDYESIRNMVNISQLKESIS
jgi:predicted dehydrogenase